MAAFPRRAWERSQDPYREQAHSHIGVHPTKQTGRPVGRLGVLLICPPLREAECRCSSGDWRTAPLGEAEDIAWRSSRSRPEGDAP